MGRLIDLRGQTFGKLTVVGRSPDAPGAHGADAVWRCRCECGAIVDKTSYAIRHGKTPSCGCAQSASTSDRCLTISVGDRFGRLTVASRVSPVGVKPVVWLCSCDCGGTVKAPTWSLRSGNTRSCGCIHSEQLAARNKTHGQSGTRLYNIWRGMKSRCNNPNDTVYRNYGAKGVTVCDEWQHDFIAFKEWSDAHGYNPASPRNLCTIDRIDPFGNYCPENCRWVDMSVQNRNKRRKT